MRCFSPVCQSLKRLLISASPFIMQPCFWNSARVSMRLEKVELTVNSVVPVLRQSAMICSISLSQMTSPKFGRSFPASRL